jgi:hypothetical protein
MLQLTRSLVLAHPRRLTEVRFAIQLAHAEFQVVQVSGFGEERVSAFFGELFGRLRQKQE